MRKLYPFVYLIFFLNTSCTTKDNGRIVNHPLEDKSPKITNNLNRVDLSSNKIKKTSYNFDSLKLVSKIQHEDKFFNSSPGIFDAIKIDRKGNSYFVGLNKTELYVFDKTGNYSYKIGKEGRGPGDFLEIIDFDISGNTMLVLDRNEIDIYKSNTGKFKYDRSIIHKLFFVNDICILGNYIFVAGNVINRDNFKLSLNDSTASGDKKLSKENFLSGLPIHKFSLMRDTLIKSFGFSYESSSKWPPFSSILSKSRIECIENTEIVISINSNFGYLNGYNTEGTLQWSSIIENYGKLFYKEIKKPIPTLGIDDEKSSSYSSVRSFITINDNYSLIQISPTVRNLQEVSMNAIKKYLNGKKRTQSNVLINNPTGNLKLVNLEFDIIKDSNKKYLLVAVNKGKKETTGLSYFLYGK